MLPPRRRAAAGIGWVPQERNIFKSLTVHENLSAVARPGAWTVARAYEMFPRPAERRSNTGNQLPGGEQQMLAVARALVQIPTPLLLDEPLEGLAPIIVEELLRSIARVVRDEGMSAIIVEQNPRLILPITQRAVVLGPRRGGARRVEGGAARRPRTARPLARGGEALNTRRRFEPEHGRRLRRAALASCAGRGASFPVARRSRVVTIIAGACAWSDPCPCLRRPPKPLKA